MLNIILICLVIVFLGISVFLILSLKKLKKRTNLLFKGKKTGSLEELVMKQTEEIGKQEKTINEILKKINVLEESSQVSFQKIGIKRFNPFGNVGGDQSFVLSLLDKQNNGFIISSLYTREGNRVYAKPLKKGKSKYPLSKEEEKIISQVIKK